MKSRSILILIIIGLAIGLLLTAQWKTPPHRIVNPISPYLALRQTNKDLIVEQTRLKNAIASTQTAISEESSKGHQDSLAQQLMVQAQAIKETVGLTEISGAGITVLLDDAPSGKGTVDNITHAADLRDIVNVLWRNQAKAISINGERVVANTSIDCIVNTILINSTRLAPPFTITAIGDATKLEKSMHEAADLSDLNKRAKSEGLILEVKTAWKLAVPAFNGSFILHFAKAE